MKRPGLLLALALAVGGALRLGYGLWRPPPGSPPHGLPDTDSYVSLALSVARDWSFTDENGPTAHREPGYPALLGLAFKAFGPSYGVLLGVNTALGLACLVFIYLAGRRLFGEPAALAAAGLGAVYPPFVYYAAQPLRETLMSALAPAAIWALLAARDSGRSCALAGAGLLCAAAGLTNTAFLPFGLLVAPGVLAWLERGDRDRAARLCGPYLAAFLALTGAWPLRNQLALGAPFIGGTGGGWTNLYIYQVVPQELGGTPEQARILDSDPVALAAVGLPPVEREKFMLRAGLAKIAESPLRYVRLVAWRSLDLWRPLPRPRAYAHGYRLLWWASLLSDGWIIPLGLAGICLARLRAPGLLWVYGLLGSVHLVYALVFTVTRYRLPLMPWVLLFAAHAAARLTGRSD